MKMETIEHDFRNKVCEQVHLESEGVDRYRVFTPFQFEDGDHLAIVLKRSNSHWVLSDEGHTFMHLTYGMDEKDLQRGTRQRVIDNALAMFRVLDQEGELVLPIEEDRYGDALYSFAQALVKITDVAYLKRERVKSTFMEDFRVLLRDRVAPDRLLFEWHDADRDAKGLYGVDCRINGMAVPLFVYALPSDNRTRDATIALQQFEKWGMKFYSLAIFEYHGSINRKVLARFSDVCEKQFSNMVTNRERIGNYLGEVAG